MKKLVCLILCALLFASAMAYGDAIDLNAAAVDAAQPITTEDQLYAMIPVLDSLARNMGVEGEIPYDPANPLFVWAQLYLQAVNWIGEDETTLRDGESLTGPAALCWSAPRRRSADSPRSRRFPRDWPELLTTPRRTPIP